MKKTVLVCILMLTVSFLFAQQGLKFDDWKITNFGSGKSSEKNAGTILLRQYSPVEKDGLNLDASVIILNCKWMNPLNYVDMGVQLTITYQGGAREIIEQSIPKGVSAETKLLYKLKNANGKKIIKLEIQHGQTGMEVKILSVEAGAGLSCCDKVQSTAADFSALLEEMKKAKDVNDAYIKKLEKLLNTMKEIK